MVKKMTIKTNCGSFVCHFASDRGESGYTITVPALKGLVTEGRTLLEGKRMVREAIEVHCEGLLSSGLARIVPLKTQKA